jgi:hypothetical protein
VDRWHLASQELVSGRVEKLVLKVARCEDMKQRSGEEAVSHPFEKDRWWRSKDLTNSGACRVRAQVLGIQIHEDARIEKVNIRWIRITGGLLDLHVGSCIRASREKARELSHGNRKVARERGRKSRHLRHRESMWKLFNLVSSEVASGEITIAWKSR